MRLIIITFGLFFISVSLFNCNPAKRIAKKKDISEECKESIIWLYNTFEKKNGLLKVKIDNFEKDTAFQNQISIRFYKNYGFCLFQHLSKEEVKTLYGEPNNIVTNQRTKGETYYYHVMSNNCRSISDLNSNNDCGHIYFSFDKNSKPINGLLEFTKLKDLE